VTDPSDHALKPGDVLAGKYVLGERLGSGGMGVVFLAEQPELQRRVAVKVLHPHLAHQAMFARRFQTEAVAASRVRHRCTISIIDFDVEAGATPYIAMELAPGRPLGQLLDEEVVPLRRALGVFDQILSALEAVHACSIVHGDVKSDNFIVEQQARGDVVKMIDFGLAQLDGAVADPGLVAGTPEYMAPELARGEPATRASDLYGAGIILYELLTGATPFAGGSTSEILQRQLEDVVVPPSLRRPDRDIPPALDRLVVRALEKDPAARFASAQELRAALAAVAIERERPSPRRHLPPAPGRTRSTAQSPTRTCIAPPSHRRLARGSDATAAASSGGAIELRRAIGEALVRGDVAAIAGGYLALARALARDRHLGAAICELEEGIDVITAGRGPASADSREWVDQLVTSLAALYERADESGKARLTLSSTDSHATLVEAVRSEDPPRRA
jgi:serine/threonine-protein kinase